MRKLEVNVYKFNELKKQVQTEVIAKIREWKIEDAFKDLKDYLYEVLEYTYDLKVNKLIYSLSYSQGDGLSFSCSDLLESKYILNEIKQNLSRYEKAMFTKLRNNGIIYYLKSECNTGHYCYASKNQLELQLDQYPYGNYTTEFKEKLYDKILDIVGDVYMDICKDLETIGYGCYNVSDKEVIDYINDLELEFFENGEVV